MRASNPGNHDPNLNQEGYAWPVGRWPWPPAGVGYFLPWKGREGKGSWPDERYDRIVRDEAEFLEKWNYSRNNPGKAGLAASPEDYPWLHEKGT